MSLEGAVASDAARAWPVMDNYTYIPPVAAPLGDPHFKSTKKSARTVAGASAVDILLSLAGDGQKFKTPPVATLLSGADYSPGEPFGCLGAWKNACRKYSTQLIAVGRVRVMAGGKSDMSQ